MIAIRSRAVFSNSARPTPDLVLKKLAHRTHPAIAQMIDIVRLDDFLLQPDQVLHYRRHILGRQ